MSMHLEFYKLCITAATFFLVASIPLQAKADADAINRGSALYYGTTLQERHVVEKSALVTANLYKVAACAGCHRPSALGGFEGGVAVPPITGQFLFSSFEPLTVNRFPWPTTLRKRPAYTVASLRAALNSGITVDGLTISNLMPRYALSDVEVSDLAEFLKYRSEEKTPGITNESIRFATITTPEISEDEQQSLVQTLNTFFIDKNAETRLETRRRSTSLLNKETMYVRYRKWELEHWALKGAADTWRAQLESLYSKSPVFAIISGIGKTQWQPVDDFCGEKRLPCLFPQTTFTPAKFNFYSLYFDAGLHAQTQWILQEVLEKYSGIALRYAILSDQNSTAKSRVHLINSLLSTDTNKFIEVEPKQADILISMLPVDDTVHAVRENQLQPSKVYVLHAAQTMLNPSSWGSAMQGIAQNSTWFVIDRFQTPSKSNPVLRRSNIWFKSKKIKPANEVIAANALFSATLAVDALAHIDSNFSREYSIEKLEHSLENAVPLSSYARLSLSANQRFASKGFGVFTKAAGQNEFVPTWIIP
jgi:hypothetical protein